MPDIHPLLHGLNNKQTEAVLCTDGPLMVVAGAGSGKTRVLTHRIAYLIQECKVAPTNILAVTFTNKAAGEMRERLKKLLGVKMGKHFNSALPVVGTFHSFGVQFLRREIQHLGLDPSFLIYDDVDQLSLVKKILKEFNFPQKKNTPNLFLNQISWAKSNLLSAMDFADTARTAQQRNVAEVYLKYEKTMHQRNALDFDDLIYLTVRVLKENPEVLEKYQERFKYISVDEYQDTNHAQYELTNLLAKKYQNLCVIGDSDQSIYSWRGANYQNLLNFKHDYPKATVILLEQNYRSTQNILDVGNAVISQNQKREDKNLWTENDSGEKVIIETNETEQGESQNVVQKVLEMVEEHGFEYRDCAVLYRLSAQSRALEEACIKSGIPYRLVGGVKFYSRKEIKDMLAYLRLARYPQDDESFMRIINVPSRKIGAVSLAKLQDFALSEQITLMETLDYVENISGLTASVKNSLAKLRDRLAELREVAERLPVSGVINFVNDELAYRAYLLDGTEEGETRWENIQELLGVAKKYDALEGGLSLATFLEDTALFTSLDGANFNENSVTLMTLHSAKGLEFPIVFIVGMEEGILPHSRALFDPEQMEEERRLFYVGVTRAKQRLILLRAKRRLFYGGQNNPTSRFLTDLPEEAVSKDFESSEGEMELLEKLKEMARQKNGWY